MNKRIGKNDIFFLMGIVLLATVLIVVFYSTHSQKGSYAKVTVDGKVYGEYSLFESQTVEIKNQDGDITNYLVIKDGYADITEANCPDKLCAKQKKSSLDRETIVCLPNKVVVEIISNSSSDVDAVAN